MTDHGKISELPTYALTRREVMKGAGAVGSLGLLGVPAVSLAQSAKPIETLGIGALFTPALKPIVEKEANVSLTNGPFQSSVDAVSRLTAPGGTQYDLIISSYDFSQPVVMGAKAGDERTQPIKLDLVPNIKNINDVSQYALSPRDGKYYIVPICWGFDTVLYNRDHVPENDPYTQSWGLLFEDKYAGRIAWWDTSLNMLLAAGLYLGHAKPDLMDRKDLDEVAKFLISKKKNVRTIFTTFAQGTNLLASGEVVVAYGLVTMRVELEQKGVNIAGSWAKEGVLSLIQSGYIPKSSSRAESANAVINTMLDKTYAGALTRACGYLSTSKLAQQEFTPDERKRYGFGMFDGTVKHYPQKMPTSMNMWIETWSRVKSA
jgi:spermidine/putrescine transport system substrate-binding protein